MLLPDSMELRICVPYNSRSTAWASFDGRGRVELRRECSRHSYPLSLKLTRVDFVRTEGDHIKVTASPYPFPTVCADKQSTDWFGSIQRTLKWNERQRQKSFVILVSSNVYSCPVKTSETDRRLLVHRRKAEKDQRDQQMRPLLPRKRNKRLLPRLLRNNLDSLHLAMVLSMRKMTVLLL
jgi:hypothetical protein